MSTLLFSITVVAAVVVVILIAIFWLLLKIMPGPQ